MKNCWSDCITDILPPAHPYYLWLTRPNNLAEVLASALGSIKLTVVEQSQGASLLQEAQCLSLEPNEQVLVREIYLSSDSGPCSFGRSVYPAPTYTKHLPQLTHLGRKLLGRELLYFNPNVTRSAFQFKCFDADDPLFQQLPAVFFSPHLDTEYFFARRSIFNIFKAPFLLTEVFMPNLPDYPEQR